jgi:hypothetical protein
MPANLKECWHFYLHTAVIEEIYGINEIRLAVNGRRGNDASDEEMCRGF